MDEILNDLFSYLRFASISGDPKYKGEVNACADWLTARFERAGLDAQKYPTAGHPIVVARSRPQKDRKTVLIYGHYDVQPPDPVDLWNSPPFEPTVQNGRVIARASSDNKGQLLPHLFADDLETGCALPSSSWLLWLLASFSIPKVPRRSSCKGTTARAALLYGNF